MLSLNLYPQVFAAHQCFRAAAAAAATDDTVQPAVCNSSTHEAPTLERIMCPTTDDTLPPADYDTLPPAADCNTATEQAPSFENIMWPTTTTLPMEPIASAATPSKRPYVEEEKEKSPRAKKARRMAFKARRGKPLHGLSNCGNRRSTRMDSWGLVDYETNPEYYEVYRPSNPRSLPVITETKDEEEEEEEDLDDFVTELVAEVIKIL
ncbi:hypothetical protein H4S07_000343 [Coemansia furcata]|uniref:Uncharacterized protein n=1 Tax=Coemansia furcata TaxID=417177 RepID=A0ACC1LS25_9FUNG|nr:hypothetical protein H4S07_000343 [Coemansia furcata]